MRKQAELLEVTEENLTDFVGRPKFVSDRMYDVTPVGVVMGLAWNSMGGATLYIESSVADYTPQEEEDSSDDEAAVVSGCGKGKTGGSRGRGGSSGSMYVTGMMGDVMKESSSIAYTVAKAFCHKVDPKSDFFSRARIHMHVPEGATPKDGPSAGITMITSLLSLALNRPALADVAMTGEVTLTGKVLGIGGVKEKIIASRRSNVTTVLLPASNKAEYEELPEYIKEGMTIHYVAQYQDVYDIVFPAVAPTQENL